MSILPFTPLALFGNLKPSHSTMIGANVLFLVSRTKLYIKIFDFLKFYKLHEGRDVHIVQNCT